MSAASLSLAQRPEAYELALEVALEAMRDGWYCPSSDIALIEELRDAFRVAEVPKRAAA